MKWLRENAAWIGVVTSLVAAGVVLLVRAELADTAVKFADVNARVGRLEQVVSDHLRAAEEDRASRRLVLQKLDALCRATPQADCPLGNE